MNTETGNDSIVVAGDAELADLVVGVLETRVGEVSRDEGDPEQGSEEE